VWDQAAEAAAEADLVILFGTDHYGNDPFTLTRQSYATPYGILPTPQNIVDHLVDVLGEEEAFAGELRHRNEHSLELVAVWLHHMRGGRPVELVPILCGSLGRGQNGPVSQQAEAVVAALRQEIAGRKALVVASGDLTHVGTAFGGGPLDATLRAQIRRADEELIDHMRAGDADAFLRSIRRVQNRYNVCGVSPIYLTMRLLGGVGIAGRAAGYASCPADATDTSAVTIGGVLFGPKA
jgi:AmmeMemoRadiSam system protein B